MDPEEGVHRRFLDAIASFRARHGGNEGGRQQLRQQQQQQQLLQQKRRLAIVFPRPLAISDPVNRQSVQYLADFFRGGTYEVNELELLCQLASPSDGAVQVLRDLFANGTNDTTTNLTTVKIWDCDLGNAHDTAQVLTAFRTNRSVTDLRINSIKNLFGADLGTCLSTLLQNNTQLERLCVCKCSLRNGARAFQRGLRSNQKLKDLSLPICELGDEEIRLIVDALVGNTTLEVFDISESFITPNGLDDITRLLGSTRLTMMNLSRNNIFGDDSITRRFAHALARNVFLKTLIIDMQPTMPSISAALIFRSLESNTVLEELRLGLIARPRQQYLDQLVMSLPRIKGLKRLCCSPEEWDALIEGEVGNELVSALHQNTSVEELFNVFSPRLDVFPLEIGRIPRYLTKFIAISHTLARNRSMRRATELLGLQPGTGRPIPSKSGIWYMAMEKLDGPRQRSDTSNDEYADEYADDDVIHNGASALFKIFQARPVMLERQLQQPADGASAAHVQQESARRQQQDAQVDTGRGGGGGNDSLDATAPAQKRRRQS